VSTAYLQRPLSYLLANGSHLSVLRALRHNREGMSGREIAREAQVNHQTCADVLYGLESLGVVQRQGTGRTQLWRLRRNNRWVQKALIPLFQAESDWVSELRRDIRDAFAKDVKGIILFGSVARGEETPQSDWDVLLVADRNRHRQLTEKISTFSAIFQERYGMRFSAILITEEELNKKARTHDPLIVNIRKDRIDLMPLKNPGVFA